MTPRGVVGDAGNPKPDAPADVAPDVAPDVSMDARTDVGIDAAPDAAPDVARDAEDDVARDVPADLPPPCATTETRCGERCVDVQTDGSHCGGCGNTCGATTTCRAGMCVPTCGATEALCGSPARCVNTQTDGDHCGGCGAVCPAGQVCGAGVCARSCTAPAVACAAADGSMACADLQTDRANCGRCNTACAAGQTCVAGVCITPRAECPSGQTDCAPTDPAPMCVDTAASATRCGRCGNACAMGQVCTAGACVTPRAMCPSGQSDCAPTAPAPACFDTQTSEAHCGGCGAACPAGQVCAAGACACPTGTTLCGGACVNPQTDGAHCGACNMACPTGQVCSTGACRLVCMAPTVTCTAPGGAMTCASLQTDRSHCGARNVACPAAQSCTAGACACAAGLTLCGADCVNTMTDTVHCGSCATACGVGQVGTGGRCESTACPRCARVAFAEDWESGVTAWHDPSNRGPIVATTDSSGCRGSFVRETVRVGGGRIYSVAGTPVTAGRTYCASSWIRGSAGTWPFVGIRASNAAGALGNEHWLIGQPCFGTGIAGTVAPITSDGAWRWYGREFVMPAYTHVVLELEIWDGGAVGTADFDQVQLLEGPCPPAPTTACAAATCSM